MNDQYDQFQELLESDLPQALEYRIQELEEQSNAYMIAVGVAQVTSFSLLAASLPLSLTPFVPVVAFAGALSLGYTCFRDYFTTGNILSVPYTRKSVQHKLKELAAHQAKMMYGENYVIELSEDHNVTASLSKKEVVEYRLLINHSPFVVRVLQEIPIDKRFRKYQTLISEHGRGKFPSKEMIQSIQPTVIQEQPLVQQTPPATTNLPIAIPTPLPEPPSVSTENTPEARMEKEVGGMAIVQPPIPSSQLEVGMTTSEPRPIFKDIPEQPNEPDLPQEPDQDLDKEDHIQLIDAEIDDQDESEAEDLLDVTTLLNLPQTSDEDEEEVPVPRYLQAFMQPDFFPEEDLALELAKTTIDVRNAGATLIACPKGTGKSNLLRAAMSAANNLHQSNVDYMIFAGKDDETYCGLENNHSIYLSSGDVQNAPEVVRRMAEYQSRLKKFCGRATILISDEYNNTLAGAGMYDKLNGAKPKYEDLITALTYERITKGRSKLVCDWITSHEADVRAIKFSLSLQQSLNFVVLGRGNKMAAINAALTGRRPIVDDEQIRDQLKAQFTNYRQNNPVDFNTVIALTNLNGEWRLVCLPKYPDQQPPLVLRSKEEVELSEETPEISSPCVPQQLQLQVSEPEIESPSVGVEMKEEVQVPDDDFQPIVEYVRKKKAPIRASELIAGDRYLRSKYKNTDAINQLFLQAEELGIGFTRWSGKVLEFFVL